MDITPNLVLEQLQGYVYIKDFEGHYLWSNRLAIKAAGLNTLSKFEGLSDYDAPWAQYAENYLSHDLDVKKKLTYDQIDMILFHDGTQKLLLNKKIPYKNKQGEVIALLGLAYELKSKDITSIARLLDAKNPFKDGKSIIISDNNYLQSKTNKLKLTIRETECLFFLMRGGTSKSIASRLGLSPRTIDAYTENIKIKFNCRYKAELIEKAMEYGMYHFIPNSLML